MRGGVGADARLDVLERLRALQIDGLHLEAAAEHVRVDVVESGHHRAAVRVDDLRVGSPPLRDLVVRAEGSNPVAGNGERLVQAAAVRRVNGAVDHDEIGGSLEATLKGSPHSSDFGCGADQRRQD